MTYFTQKKILFIIVLCSSIISNSQEKKTTKFGKGIFNFVDKDSTWSMKAGFRFQNLATFSRLDQNGMHTSETNMSVRRARIKLDGFAYSPKLTYKVEIGLSNRDISGGSQFTGNADRYLYDAVLKWNFYKNFSLWFGQAKLPGNRERIVSSGNMQLVDRSLLNSLFNIDRDIGIQLKHFTNITDTFLIKETFSIAQGEGRNVTTGNIGGQQYTAKIELFPFGSFKNNGAYSGSDIYFEETPKLAFAVAYDFNNNAVKTRSNQGNYMFNDTGFYTTNISSLFIDTMYKHRGFSFMGEYANRTAENPAAINSDGSFTGDYVQTGDALNLQAGWLLTKKLEIAARYTHINMNTAATTFRNENQYTIGLSKYIVNHKLKVQTDVSYTDIGFKTNQILGRFQVDIHF